MRIIIITTDELFYLPLTIQKLLESPAKQNLTRIVLLPPTAKKRTWGDIISEQLRFGLVYFFYRSFQYVAFKWLAKKNVKLNGRYYSVEAAANAFDVPISKIQNVNSDEALDIIGREAPDLIVSLSASQIFSKKVIRLPQWAAINVHNSPLPRYQGLMPSFWVLYHGETETAVTVHLMDEKIDTGDIVLQKRVPISEDETLDSLIRKTKMLTVDALLEVFSFFEEYGGKPPVVPNSPEKATYFGFPERKDIRRFRQSGRKVLWKNIY